ncbi:hypothetical protein V8G54_018964 [Vigna mungo]|uniref:Uncharacterized protein n=1 Tax=Vigna mungo TaxID=3915 RepID=A0AAQ3NB97_VIGMU
MIIKPRSDFGDFDEEPEAVASQREECSQSREEHMRRVFSESSWNGGEDAREVAEVRVGGEDDVGHGFEMEERVNDGAGISWEEEGERIDVLVKGFGSLRASILPSHDF